MVRRWFSRSAGLKVVRLTLALLPVGIAGIVVGTAIAVAYDGIYPTAIANWTCQDNGNSSPSGGFCLTDNSTLTVYVESSISWSGESTISGVLSSDFAPTDFSVTEESSGTYSGGSETDIIYQYRTDLPVGVAGVAWCDDAVSSIECDQHYVAFDNSSPQAPLVCHETGHAVGLTHGDQAYPTQPVTNTDLGCMGQSVVTTLGSYNQGQINATY